MKKILIILIILLIIIAIAFLSWKFFFEKTTPEIPPAGKLPTTADSTFSPEEKTTTIESAGKTSALANVSQAPVFGYWLNKNTQNLFYFDLSGNLYENGERVSSQLIPNLHSLNASPDGTKVIVTFDYPFKTIITIFDTENNAWQPLPTNTTSAAWDPTSNNRLVYLTKTGNQSSINLLTLNTKKSQKILSLNQSDLDLEWILPNIIYLKEKPSAEYLSSVWSLDIKTTLLAPLIREEPGADILWSRDGKIGLKLNSNGFNHSLTLVNDKNQPLASLPEITIPSKKCVFSEASAFCAIPVSLPRPRLNLPDDYLKKRVVFSDLLYKVDISSGTLELLPENDTLIEPSEEGITITDISNLSLIGDKLYFINGKDRKLYSMEIK